MSKKALYLLFMILMACIMSATIYGLGQHFIYNNLESQYFLPLIILGSTTALTTFLVSKSYANSET